MDAMLVFSHASAATWSDLMFDGRWENCNATGRALGEEDMVVIFETDDDCPTRCFLLLRRFSVHVYMLAVEGVHPGQAVEYQ